jgi:hypothetical protein
MSVKKPYKRIQAFVFLSLVCWLVACRREIASFESGTGINYEYVKMSLGEAPGFGIETTGRGPVHQPMAYGLVAWAASEKADVKYARLAADWLIENSSPDKRGWGLDWEWDAFGNGVINPADTVYGITTAIAVDGLLRTYLLTQNRQYLDAAQDALNYYMQFQCPESGHFFYSDQLSDSAYKVPNITAMLMGQYAHAGGILGNRSYIDVASRAYVAMQESAVVMEEIVLWKYAHGLENERDNDLVHASYIVYGLYLYEKHTPAVKHASLAPMAASYLDGFIDGDIFEFNIRDRSAGLGARKARIWGAGMLLYVASALDEQDLMRAVLAKIPKYEYATQRFSYRRGDDLHCPRAVAHLLLGYSLIDK